MKIIGVDEIVLQDLGFDFQGTVYRVPGNIDSDTALRLQFLWNDLQQAEGRGEPDEKGKLPAQDRDGMRRLTREIGEELLKLFQVYQPDLEKLPFGFHAFAFVTATILGHLGFVTLIPPEEESADPPTKAKRKMAVPKPAKSRRSSSSSRSAKP